MVVSKKTIERIRKLVDLQYKSFALSLLGRKHIPQEILRDLSQAGIDINKTDSLPELVYVHNYLNKLGNQGPNSIEDMLTQQSGSKPEGQAHDASIEHLSASLLHLLEKHKTDMISRIESLIRDGNSDYVFNALQNLTRPADFDKEVKEKTLGQIKRDLRDLSEDANRNWERVAVTEISNAIGRGSVDRLVVENREKSLDEVYVYRIVVRDSALCKYCRKFYLDADGTPKLYKLSTLLNNGSNYGKRAAEWLPVVLATHPNERCSPVIELKPGWKVSAGGTVTYIGMEKWSEYIASKIQ